MQLRTSLYIGSEVRLTAPGCSRRLLSHAGIHGTDSWHVKSVIASVGVMICGISVQVLSDYVSCEFTCYSRQHCEQSCRNVSFTSRPFASPSTPTAAVATRTAVLRVDAEPGLNSPYSPLLPISTGGSMSSLSWNTVVSELLSARSAQDKGAGLEMTVANRVTLCDNPL